MQLKSRAYPSPADFVRDFLETITPGVIPRERFINWRAIDSKMMKLSQPLEFYSQMAEVVATGKEFAREIADSLLASDDPLPLVRGAFELIGHTGSDFVTQQDDIQIAQISGQVKDGDEQSALYLASLLADLGFKRILERDDLDDVLLGVQLGLETHRRKNVGGEHFRHFAFGCLKDTTLAISNRIQRDVNLTEEKALVFGNNLSKRVDFVIKVDGITKFGIEVNFYTTSGSKPTEIKRSYGNIREGLSSVGVDLIWITDGNGHKQMQRSLRDAYVILPNIYTLRQAQQFLGEDLIAVLANT